VLREFDAHLVVSDRERDKLLALAPEARVFLIENGVDTQYYSDERIEHAHARWSAQRSRPAESSGAQPDGLIDDSRANRVLFVGSMDYHANIDGVVDFGRRVWPLVHQEKPELIFTIVGRDPAPEVRRLAEIPGIEVTGTVEDVRPYYREALAALIPLRVGGGSRLKILEAMAAGVPVLSTRLGAEGIEARGGESIILTETNDDLRAALIELTGNDERRRKLAVAGRALACARYDWTQLGAALFEIYEQLLGERQALSM
jgi:glycosyltransferase involved in cell wall biosynthesis